MREDPSPCAPPAPPAPSAGEDRPLVSIVVPTYRSAATVGACLRSIRGQTYPRTQSIVVDNHSDDGTAEIAADVADVVVTGGPERSAQRNRGVELADGTFVLWIDSDMELPPELVSAAVDAALRSGAVAVFIPEVTVGTGFWTRCRTLERRCYTGEDMIGSPRLVRRDYLLRTGGFVEWLSGTEDAELRMRMLGDGSTLARTPSTIVHLEGRLTLGGVARKRFYYGRGLPRYRAAHPGAMRRQAAATLRAYVRNGRLLVRHPILAAGMAILRGVEVSAYLAGAAAGAVEARRSSPRPTS